MISKRVQDLAETTAQIITSVFLDWEKAFDKIDREGLYSELGRMGAHEKIIRNIRNIYKTTEFCVEIDEVSSEWKGQGTGIRQGCPLSPYLFILVMTVIMYDTDKLMALDEQHSSIIKPLSQSDFKDG